MENLQQHWDNIFEKTEDKKLGWYEENFTQSTKFLDLNEIKNKIVFVCGAGTSQLIDELIDSGQLILNDISKIALQKLENRYSNQNNIKYFHHNLAVNFPMNFEKIDIWIDRAVLHFLINEDDIKNYFSNLNENLKVGGYAFFAQFRIDGATSCASLPIKQYSKELLKEYLGENFVLEKEENFTFINPFGSARPYIYALFKKIK